MSDVLKTVYKLIKELNGTTEEDMLSSTRDGVTLESRYLLFLAIKDFIPSYSEERICHLVNRDRTTVNRWGALTKNLYQTDPMFNKKYNVIKDVIINTYNYYNAESVEVFIRRTVQSLLSQGQEIFIEKWQAKQVNQYMVEIRNVFGTFILPRGITEVVRQVKPDLPWAEDHFKERVSGQPTNPGKEYLNWPYYKPGTFMEGDIFSHTYQERFWPKNAGDAKLMDVMKSEGGDYTTNHGIRFEYGDYQDVVDLLRTDNHTRQAFLSIWHPEDQGNHGVRVPCTIGYHFMIRENRLHLTYLIRSCDAIRHFRNDVYMAIRLMKHTLHLLNIPDLRLGEMSMWIGSFHCFKSDLYTLNKQVR